MYLYRKTKECQRLRKLGIWGKRHWPESVYHLQLTKKCIKHHAQALADAGVRRAKLKSSTPTWASKKAIKEIYLSCIKATKETGIKHEVDHIIPLRGEFVSGLHVEWNLQVIKAVDNRIKSNKV
jgi:5-methylcytosine-specific restriction endonuclease McrA